MERKNFNGYSSEGKRKPFRWSSKSIYCEFNIKLKLSLTLILLCLLYYIINNFVFIIAIDRFLLLYSIFTHTQNQRARTHTPP